jgi:hypothetical protein
MATPAPVRRFLPTSLLLLTSLGSPLWASAPNLLQNGEFDDGLTGWAVDHPATTTVVNGGFDGDRFGLATGKAVRLAESRHDAFGHFTRIAQCVDLPDPLAMTYDFDAWVQLSSLEAGSDVEVILQLFSDVDCGGTLQEEKRRAVGPSPGVWTRLESQVIFLDGFSQPAKSVAVYLALVKRFPSDSAQALVDRVYFGENPAEYGRYPCLWEPDNGYSQSLCLNRGRFQVSALWENANGTGSATPIQVSGDSGYLWFFNANNLELFVKVLNGCGINGKYWVFATGLTNVRVSLEVRDLETGEVWTYENPLGTSFQPQFATSAFACP